MNAVLTESDALVDEVIASDVLVLGVPLYNFGMPAGFKAWIDNIVRVDRTVAFDPNRPDDPYLPLLNDRRVLPCCCPHAAVMVSIPAANGTRNHWTPICARHWNSSASLSCTSSRSSTRKRREARPLHSRRWRGGRTGRQADLYGQFIRAVTHPHPGVPRSAHG